MHHNQIEEKQGIPLIINEEKDSLEWKLFLPGFTKDDIDVIIHLAAAHKDYGLSVEDYNSVNVKGIENLLKVAEKNVKLYTYNV